MAADPSTVSVDEVAAEATYALRAAVLRPGGGDVVWAGDEDPATFHLAARTPDGRIVGVVRFSPAACAWRLEAAAPWQLRGMAIDAAVRGAGSGRVLVAAGLDAVAARGGDLLWCDARVTAAGFYERMGFTVVTEPYDKPGTGPHLGMLKDLQKDPVLPTLGGSRRDPERGRSPRELGASLRTRLEASGDESGPVGRSSPS